MADIHIFRTDGPEARELKGSSVALEKSLQTYIEENLESILGITFLESEYSTGKTHAGRIDTLGIDENGFPVIIEYKRAVNENVINQGLYYLDWLLDHKAEFELMVLKRLGRATGSDWTGAIPGSSASPATSRSTIPTPSSRSTGTSSSSATGSSAMISCCLNL